MKTKKCRLGVLIVLLGFAALLFAEIKITTDYNDNRTSTRGFKFKNISAPVQDDAAAQAKLTLVEGDIDGNGADLSALTDGKLPTEEDEPAANFFFNAGMIGGRFRMDLGSAIEIAQVNTYSWHPNTRGPQVYKLYGSDGSDPKFDATPKDGADPAARGWNLIAVVDTRPRQGDGGGQHGVSIANPDGILGKYRFLLFSCVANEVDDDYGNTFYSEIDVIAKK